MAPERATERKGSATIELTKQDAHGETSKTEIWLAKTT